MLIVRSGRQNRETETLLGLQAAQLTLTLQPSGVVRGISYSTLEKGHYSRSTDPLWSVGDDVARTVLTAPASRATSTSHWLTLETGGDVVVLRLAEGSHRTVLEGLMKRGLDIDTHREAR